MKMQLVDLSVEELLELAGESAVEDVKQLNLRSRGLTTFAQWTCRLSQLEGLSLSHNRLVSLTGFSVLHSLTTLNINNNALTSLAGIEGCSSLQQLYAANNRIRDLQPIAKLSQLQSLCCIKNTLASLEGCLQVLVGLPHLTELDLLGNPVSGVPSSRAHFLNHLPGLATLDGEKIADLDRQLAFDECGGRLLVALPEVLAVPDGPDLLILNDNEDAIEGQLPDGSQCNVDYQACLHASEDLQPQAGQPAYDCQRSSSSNISTGIRPGTAEVRGYRLAAASNQEAGTTAKPPVRPGTASRPFSARPGQLHVRPATAMPWQVDCNGTNRPCTPGSVTQLFSNNLLNDHPLVLEYLAKHVLDLGLETVGPGAAGKVLGNSNRQVRGSFAARLRTAATVMSGAEDVDVRHLIGSDVLQSALPSNGSMVEAAQTVLKDATPAEMIRQLVKLAEVLIQQLNVARRPSSSSCQLCSGRASPASRPASKPSTPSLQHETDNLSNHQETTTLVNTADRGELSNKTDTVQDNACGSSDSANERQKDLMDELEALRREVKQLRQENQNIYWLADEYKRLKAELAGSR